jgi:hypothetical protein
MGRTFFRSTGAAIGACALIVAGSAFGAEGTKNAAPPGKAAAPQVSAPPFTKPIPLTEEKVKGFLGAMEELKALGEEGKKFSATNPSLVKTMQFDDKTKGIIKKHGFAGVAEFQQVAFNASAAYYVVKNGGKEGIKKKLAENDVKRAEAIEKLKAHLTPDQLKMLETQIGAGTATMHALADQPDANLELIKKYSDQMEAVGKK